MALQFQAILDYLYGPISSGFELGCETETALDALVDNLCQGLDKESTASLVLLDLPAIFVTIDHATLLDRMVDGKPIELVGKFRISMRVSTFHLDSSHFMPCPVYQ